VTIIMLHNFSSRTFAPVLISIYTFMEQTIIIIGGLSAGPSAAAKARRVNEKAKILLFEKTDYISYATCGIPYSLSGTIKKRDKLLVVKPELLKERFNIDLHLNEPVLDILPEDHKIVTTEGTYEYTKLIYAAGATPFVPPIENLQKTADWTNCRTIEDYDKIIADGVLTEKQHITVVGAGLIGVEVAENLCKLGKNVTVVEMAPSVLSPWDSKFGNLAENVLRDNGVEVFTNTTVQNIRLEEGRIVEVSLSSGQTIASDYILMGIGGKPNTAMLASKGAETIRNGALKVNAKMETSLPDIYAAGDCASIMNIQTGEHDYFPMGTHANKGGRAAGANAAGGEEHFKGAYRTAIVKVFDYTLARTGLNARALKMMSHDHESTMIVAPSTPGFYPNPKDMLMEIYYNTNTRQVLGAEIFGEKGVDKRIDVISTAILGQLTVDDLTNLDLAYAPPFSPAKDPVIVAGFVSGNKEKNEFKEMSADDLATILRGKNRTNYQLIDVRSPRELEKEGIIKPAINIELETLRHNLNVIDKGKSTIIYCARGLRGYIATMILQNHGFRNLYNLGGGFNTWKLLGMEVADYSSQEK
jgi:NADPH-dependent 2,4-dienoyl-CoA reductase/sulfur reductase-like enzyme/rhodanese-related sulfurtransferase